MHVQVQQLPLKNMHIGVCVRVWMVQCNVPCRMFSYLMSSIPAIGSSSLWSLPGQKHLLNKWVNIRLYKYHYLKHSLYSWVHMSVFFFYYEQMHDLIVWNLIQKLSQSISGPYPVQKGYKLNYQSESMAVCRELVYKSDFHCGASQRWFNLQFVHFILVVTVTSLWKIKTDTYRRFIVIYLI